MPRPAKDMMGQKIGRLVVIARVADPTALGARWLCICDCGEQTVVFGGALRSGSTRSCGCVRREVMRERQTTHGASRDTADPDMNRCWRVWASMIARCTNPKIPNWKDYGGRGITACDRWNSFENFLADMGVSPKGLQLDRLNNDGNYDPGNCVYSTPSAQSRNRRNTQRIIIDGKDMSVIEACETYGVSYAKVREVVTHRLRYYNKRLTYAEAFLFIREHIRVHGSNHGLFSRQSVMI